MLKKRRLFSGHGVRENKLIRCVIDHSKSYHCTIDKK